MTNNKKHPFNIVTLSPWPFFIGLSLFSLVIGIILTLINKLTVGLVTLILSFVVLFLTLFNWWSDVVVESTFEGEHTTKVKVTYITGFVLFILSEIFFFGAFFWAYAHFSFSPNIDLGCTWPPLEIRSQIVHHCNLPALMNQVLIASSLTVTISHWCLNMNFGKKSFYFLLITICLGLLFTFLQYIEYRTATVSVNDGAFGSLIYLLTGFHGSHVIVGTILLIVALLRMLRQHFTKEHHIGYLTAVYYWHFVDVIWLFVYYTQYVSTFAGKANWYAVALMLIGAYTLSTFIKPAPLVERPQLVIEKTPEDVTPLTEFISLIGKKVELSRLYKTREELTGLFTEIKSLVEKAGLADKIKTPEDYVSFIEFKHLTDLAGFSYIYRTPLSSSLPPTPTPPTPPPSSSPLPSIPVDYTNLDVYSCWKILMDMLHFHFQSFLILQDELNAIQHFPGFQAQAIALRAAAKVHEESIYFLMELIGNSYPVCS
uniref:Cytochrome c oxidase subunit 3 n=1 Tax=Eukaryota sp. BB2 TaxID=1949062 RepID=A0A1X8VEX6_9EUKA|nr:cytochrome c oxidase subunit 3 [Eukaryota sp. BB2]AQL10451.1 cytochrome c oxidase subunit 3 [Eukaryota sp. BB2]